MKQPAGTVNVGRITSGGVKNGLFGNPFKVAKVVKGAAAYRKAVATAVDHYQVYLRERLANDGTFAFEFEQLKGKRLWCPGCGLDSKVCHARVIEQELFVWFALGRSQENYRLYYGIADKE
jgi:hypothetical protein